MASNNIYSSNCFCYSKYDATKGTFCNSYPCLFPGGIGDIHDMDRGTWDLQQWASHLLHYYNGRFVLNQMFFLFVFNTVQRHKNNSEGNFFFKSDCFLGKHLPTIEELKKKLEDGDDTYIQML